MTNGRVRGVVIMVGMAQMRGTKLDAWGEKVVVWPSLLTFQL